MLFQCTTDYISHKQTKLNRMAFTAENVSPLGWYEPLAPYDDALIEDLQTMDDYVFYKEHDEEFDYYEQYLSNGRLGNGRLGNSRMGNGRLGNNDRYKKLKCSPSEQIRYAEKMAVKRVNAEQKKVNDMYARNRRDARSAVLQETKEEPVFDEVDTIVDKVDTLVKDSHWVMDDDDREVDWIEKELLRSHYGAIVYQHLFGGPLEDEYNYCYI